MLTPEEYQTIQLLRRHRAGMKQALAAHQQLFLELENKQNKTEVDEAVIRVLQSQDLLHTAKVRLDGAINHAGTIRDGIGERYQNQIKQNNQHFNDRRQNTIAYFDLRRNRIENFKVASIVAGIVFIIERAYSLISPLNQGIDPNNIYQTIIFIFIATYAVGMIWWILDKKIQKYNHLQEREFVNISQHESEALQQLSSEFKNDIKVLDQIFDDA